MIPVNPGQPEIQQYARNVVEVYNRCSEDERNEGDAWYHVAHSLAEMVGAGDVRKGAGVIAALSANKGWDENVRLATDAASGNVHGHVGNALGKVRAILAGADPADVLPMERKTGHFYMCILRPETSYYVTIDRHAHDVAVGRVYGNEDRGLSAMGRYFSLRDAYEIAGRTLDILPLRVQAATWVHHRKTLKGK